MKYNKIYLKITTVPNQLDVDLDSQEIQIFKNKYENYKNLNKDSELEVAYINESGINGSFARIFSVTLGFVHEGLPVVKTMYGEETDLLDKLLSVLRQEEFSDATLIMYNRAFVLSFISKRLRQHGYSISMLPISLNHYDKKPWTIKGSKCIQEFVKGISFQTENFSETCYIHGLDPQIIEGSDVIRYIKKGNFDPIHASDIQYVYALMQIDQQLSEEPEMGKLNAHTEEVGKVQKEQINVLDHILASGQLSSKIIDEIVKFTEENDLDKENVLILVKTALSKTKEYQSVSEEDYFELKEALGLVADYSKIECVQSKGNLGKKEADMLIKIFEGSPEEEKEEVITLVNQFLTEKNKIGQKRAKEALEYLTEKLS